MNPLLLPSGAEEGVCFGQGCCDRGRTWSGAGSSFT